MLRSARLPARSCTSGTRAWPTSPGKPAIERLQEAGFTAIGLDGAAERTIFDSRCPDGRVAIVLGSERAGLSRLVRERCDLLIALPMHGRVDSLNAAASLAAALYAFVLPRRLGGDR